MVQSWRGRRRKRGGAWHLLLVLLVVGMGSTLTGCEFPPKGDTVTPEEICATPTPTGTPSPEQKCEVDHVERWQEEVVADPNRGFHKDIYMVFWLKPGTDAEEACLCGSWVQGQAGIETFLGRDTQRDYPSPTYDFPRPGIGVFYIDHAVALSDGPGEYPKTPLGLIRGVKYWVKYDHFWTVLYNKSDTKGLNKSDFRGPPNWQPVPVYIEEWNFVGEYTPS